jgi:hypothetical protein
MVQMEPDKHAAFAEAFQLSITFSISGDAQHISLNNTVSKSG